MKVLVACEYSGIVRDAFLERGHDAISCDLLPTESPGPHIQGDVTPLLRERWDMVIAHPPCERLTALNDCFVQNYGSPTWEHEYEQACAFFQACLDANAPMVAVENPIMHKKARSRFGRPDTVVHPYYFGSSYMKRTGFWLKNLPPLLATLVTANPRHWVGWKSKGRYGHNNCGHRNPKKRAQFHPEMAAAMADQWGTL